MKSTQIVLKVFNKALEISRRLSLREFVKEIGKLPGKSVLFGVAKDGQPVLLNVDDSQASNVVIWNKLAKQGLRILKVVAEYLFLHHKREDGIEFVVFTTHPDDWGDLNGYGFGSNSKTACIGIIPFHSQLAEVVMGGLARWTHENHRASKSPVIILIDGLENIEKNSDEFKFHLHYILFSGRTKHIYTVGTSNKNHFHKVQEWLDGFQREIYGSDVEDVFEYVEGKESLYFYTPKTEMI